jgi:hypothetical protein
MWITCSTRGTRCANSFRPRAKLTGVRIFKYLCFHYRYVTTIFLWFLPSACLPTLNVKARRRWRHVCDDVLSGAVLLHFNCLALLTNNLGSKKTVRIYQLAFFGPVTWPNSYLYRRRLLTSFRSDQPKVKRLQLSVKVYKVGLRYSLHSVFNVGCNGQPHASVALPSGEEMKLINKRTDLSFA